MRILHTSDWHIGKRLLGRERLAEQADALDEIAALCAKEQIDVVLVAGDVFDTYLPSAEAEDLFYEKIKKIAGDTRFSIYSSPYLASVVAPLPSSASISRLAMMNGPTPFGSLSRMVSPM